MRICGYCPVYIKAIDTGRSEPNSTLTGVDRSLARQATAMYRNGTAPARRTARIMMIARRVGRPPRNGSTDAQSALPAWRRFHEEVTHPWCAAIPSPLRRIAFPAPVAVAVVFAEVAIRASSSGTMLLSAVRATMSRTA